MTRPHSTRNWFDEFVGPSILLVFWRYSSCTMVVHEMLARRSPPILILIVLLTLWNCQLRHSVEPRMTFATFPVCWLFFSYWVQFPVNHDYHAFFFTMVWLRIDNSWKSSRDKER